MIANGTAVLAASNWMLLSVTTTRSPMRRPVGDVCRIVAQVPSSYLTPIS